MEMVLFKKIQMVNEFQNQYCTLSWFWFGIIIVFFCTIPAISITSDLKWLSNSVKYVLSFFFFAFGAFAVNVTLWSNLFKIEHNQTNKQIILYTATFIRIMVFIKFLLVSSWREKFALLRCESNADEVEIHQAKTYEV